MYDLNLSVPNITSSKYSSDNRFLLLKNYLQELNETLSFALADQSANEIISVKKELTATKEKNNNDAIKLKAQSIKRFNELKEQIIRTAEEIEASYTSALDKSEKEILGAISAEYLTKSEHGEYKNTVDTAIHQTSEQISILSENTDEIKADLENFKNTARSEIAVQADAIISQVESQYYAKTDGLELENRISSQITQTEKNITENFSEDIALLSQDISSVGGTVSELMSDLDVYIRRGELEENVYGIEIGRSDSNIKARFTNDRLSFYQGASEVAYISGSSLYITNADVLDYLRIGNFSQGYFLFDTTTNGLEVRWIDGN